jgi:ABC-type glutathione transport system ATPase component
MSDFVAAEPAAHARAAEVAEAARADASAPAPSVVPLLEVRDLTTYYPVRRGMTQALTGTPRRQVHAVDGVSFTLVRGEMMALVGESGCGKTSTLQTILGMIKPTSGTVRLDGTDITAFSERRMRPLRRTVQMIYQDPYESLDPRSCPPRLTWSATRTSSAAVSASGWRSPRRWC